MAIQQFLQGFDKYGIWKQAAHPSSNLQKALAFKVWRSMFDMSALSFLPMSSSNGPRLTACKLDNSSTFTLQAGVVSSSNSLGYSEEDMKQILANDAAVKEMEGAAIAWAAHLFDLPVLALKSITDIVDGDRPPQEEFLENLQRAALALKASTPRPSALLP